MFLPLFLNHLLILLINYLIHTVPAQIFNSISNFVMPIGVPAEEAKAETETQPKISKCSI